MLRATSVTLACRAKISLLNASAAFACSVVAVAFNRPASARSLRKGAASLTDRPNSCWTIRALLPSSPNFASAAAVWRSASAGSSARSFWTSTPIACSAWLAAFLPSASPSALLNLTRMPETSSKVSAIAPGDAVERAAILDARAGCVGQVIEAIQCVDGALRQRAEGEHSPGEGEADRLAGLVRVLLELLEALASAGRVGFETPGAEEEVNDYATSGHLGDPFRVAGHALRLTPPALPCPLFPGSQSAERPHPKDSVIRA